jgi:hypothetical protein
MATTITLTVPDALWNNYKSWACQQAGIDPADASTNSTATSRLIADAQSVGANWNIQNAVTVATNAAQVEAGALSASSSATVGAAAATPDQGT